MDHNLEWYLANVIYCSICEGETTTDFVEDGVCEKCRKKDCKK